MSQPLSFSPTDPLRAAAVALRRDPRCLDSLLDWMGDASIVLLGAGSHGTHEFLRAQIAITRRLIEESDFKAIALDADWSAVRAVNRFVRGKGRATDAMEALDALGHFPGWHWRNAEFLDFIGWLRAHNTTLPPERQTGCYGLSLFGVGSIRQIALRLFDHAAPSAAALLRQRAALPPGASAHLPLDLSAPLKEELIYRLIRHHHALAEEIMQQHTVDEDDYFFLVENARQSRNAEDYYRSLFVDETPIWQVLAAHSALMIDALREHQERRRKTKIIVWGHNILVGDSRAVQAPDTLPPSLGQIMREHHAAETYIVGQTTNHGTFAAASIWGGPVELRDLPEAPSGSVEALLHQVGLPHMMLNLHGDEEVVELLREPMLERIPGAVLPRYAPIPALSLRLADQFDAVLHFDESQALHVF